MKRAMIWIPGADSLSKPALHARTNADDLGWKRTFCGLQNKMQPRRAWQPITQAVSFNFSPNLQTTSEKPPGYSSRTVGNGWHRESSRARRGRTPQNQQPTGIYFQRRVNTDDPLVRLQRVQSSAVWCCWLNCSENGWACKASMEEPGTPPMVQNQNFSRIRPCLSHTRQPGQMEPSIITA